MITTSFNKFNFDQEWPEDDCFKKAKKAVNHKLVINNIFKKSSGEIF